MSSQSVEDYLRVIYRINEDGRPAKTGELAEILGVEPSSVTEMIKRLASENLLIHVPYKGVELTEKGRKAAERVVRKHRLLERFLHDVLGIRVERVHEEACRLEHSLSDEVADAICKTMSQPELCSDDDSPIPPCVLSVEDCADCGDISTEQPVAKTGTIQLSSMRPGQSGVVAFIRAGSTASKRILEMGLTPGVPIKIIAAAPFRGPIEVSVRGTTLALGRGLASWVFVTPDEEKELLEVATT